MLSIIIPQYNKSKMTEECIKSIIENTSEKFEIVLVDNGSSEQISDEYKKLVIYVKSEKNIYFAGGCNIGEKNASGNILCFLNNDTIVKKGWDLAVKELLSSDDIGIVGIKMIYPDGRIQHAGMEVWCDDVKNCRDFFNHRYRFFDSRDFRVNEKREYQAVTGACLFIRKEDFNKVGGFSEEYINCYEDIDLNFKVKYDLKKRIIYFPESEIIHKESQTINETNIKNWDSYKIFYEKWKDVLKEDKTFWDKYDNEKLYSKNNCNSKLSFVTPIAYDYRYSFDAIRSYYKIADEIILGIDIKRKTWSGQYYKFDEKYFDEQIDKIDIDNKIKIIESDFHKFNHPAQNDTYERNYLSKYCKDGNIIVQIDSDEILLNAEEFLKWTNENEFDCELTAEWVTVFKSFKNDKVLVIDNEDKPEIAPVGIKQKNSYQYARLTGKPQIKSGLKLLHYSWGRERFELIEKLNNWTHSRDFDINKFIKMWDGINEKNYEEIKNFHPLNATDWKKLKMVEKQTLTQK